MQKRTAPQNVFNVCNIAIMVLLMIVTLYPFYYVIVASFTSSAVLEVHTGMLWWPVNFTCKAFEVAFSHPLLLSGFKNILIIMVVSVPLSLVMTILCAYFMVSKGMLFKKPLMYLMLFTMFFGGGLIPTYLIVVELGLIDSIWSMVLPSAISTYNLIMMLTYFRTMPLSLEESARIDGANDAVILARILVPLAKPVIAVIALYIIVGSWNSYIPATIYLRDRNKFPLQVILREILISGTSNLDSLTSGYDDFAAYSESVKYTTIILSNLPVMALYPFLQKFFVKGVMLGAIKG